MQTFRSTANRITLFRIIVIPIFSVLAYQGLRGWAFAAFVVACLSDLADGYVARKNNEVTVFGAFMDPLADKMLVFSAMFYFVEQSRMPGWAVSLVLLREFAVSGLRMIAAEKNIVIAAAWSGKIKTAATMVCLAAMILFENCSFCAVCIAVIIITTYYSGIEYFVINRNVLSEGEQK